MSTKIKIKNALDIVHICRIIPVNIQELTVLDEQKVVDMTKDIMISDLIQYLIKNNYLEVKEEQTTEGLKLEYQLVVLNKEKLKKIQNKNETD